MSSAADGGAILKITAKRGICKDRALSIFLLIVYFRNSQGELPMTLSAFRSRGAERIGHVHGRNTRVFDLAGAAQRAGKAIPAFVSMRSLIDAGPAALDQARRLFDEYGKDDKFSESVAEIGVLAPVPERRQMRS